MNFFMKFFVDDLNTFLKQIRKKFKPEVVVIKIGYRCSFSSIEILVDHLTHFWIEFLNKICGNVIFILEIISIIHQVSWKNYLFNSRN